MNRAIGILGGVLVAVVVFCVLISGRPSKSEMQDLIENIPDEKTTTYTRKEMIENIGYKPDEIDVLEGYEIWMWFLKDGAAMAAVETEGRKFHLMRQKDYQSAPESTPPGNR